MDDCKISHKSKKIVDDTIEWIHKNYESIFEDGSGKMTVHQGKVHKYLGMTLDFSHKHEVRISMVDYVKDVVAAWDKIISIEDDGYKPIESKRSKKCRSAAPEDLFNVQFASARS